MSLFKSPLLASATKHHVQNVLTNTRILLWLLAFVDLELKVQTGHGSLPVFQHLPIYFGKKALVLVLGTGFQADLGYKQGNAVFKYMI